ncbi:MAG: adenylate/guanylate cyclase domain-containing protein [Bacteroidota bacterium]
MDHTTVKPKVLTLPLMLRFCLSSCLYLMLSVAVYGQGLSTELEVYEFSDGLSHRNVFKVVQDQTGLIWLATINGLNSFDGYQFRHYNPNTETGRLPAEMVADIALQENGQLVLASPDFLTYFDPVQHTADGHQIKPGQLARREAFAPHNLCFQDDVIWCTIFDEVDGTNWLARFENDSLQRLRLLPGVSTRRPFLEWQGQLIMATTGNQLDYLVADGTVSETERIESGRGNTIGVAALAQQDETLWILMEDGKLYQKNTTAEAAKLWGKIPFVTAEAQLGALLIEEDGDIWVGGRGVLWYYDHWQRNWVDYDDAIRQELRNTCTYRQIFRDRSGTIWLATDFGALKITQSDRLFDHYLSGGSDYCSNVYCSTRGMAEDERGNLYISYYNSIHVLDQNSQNIRPLFPRKDYFNYPFGLAYAAGALYTGNGLRIDLQNLEQERIFPADNKDVGVVILDRQGILWFGYEQQLYRYYPLERRLEEFFLANGARIEGSISYLYEPPNGTHLWVGTIENGVYRLERNGRISAHFHAGEGSLIRLPHQQINSIWSPKPDELWLGTGAGLVSLDLEHKQRQVYTIKNGLPNSFINGILSEGDSCLWISTDNGLARFSLQDQQILNFSIEDGLTANEFNRNSYLKASNGRLYFGGLNGVNGFLPDERYRRSKDQRRNTPLVLTTFSYLDGAADSVRELLREEAEVADAFELSYRDRMFTAAFALLDYRNPSGNTFQYYLEGYEEEWSEPSTVPMVRFSDLSPGDYTLHVRARAGTSDWTSEELTIPIHIQPAVYQRAWFWPLMILLGIIAVGGVMQFRLYALQKRREELETEVALRTRQLEEEKHKSEALLLNILPVELAEELKLNGFAKAKRHEQVTVMFSDFKGFTAISKQLEPEELVAEIDLCFRAFDEITERHGLEKIKTIGDAYLLVGGISEKAEDQAKRVVLAALEIQEFMAAIAVERKLQGRHFFEARIGIHTGPLVAGIVGIKKFAYDIWGDTVNIASRMETKGMAGRVNLSAETYQLVQHDFSFTPYGQYQENLTELDMYLVEEYLDHAS